MSMGLPETADAAIFGLTFRDAISLILVPIIAALTTLLIQDRQQTRERRMQILRALLATRHLPAAAEYNASINLVPIEFNRDREIMTAWRSYIQQVRFKPAPGNEGAQYEQIRTKQTKLVCAIMTRLRLQHSEADIQSDAYASEGFILRDNLYLDSLRADRDAADALKMAADALRIQAAILIELTKPSSPPQGGSARED